MVLTFVDVIRKFNSSVVAVLRTYRVSFLFKITNLQPTNSLILWVTNSRRLKPTLWSSQSRSLVQAQLVLLNNPSSLVSISTAANKTKWGMTPTEMLRILWTRRPANFRIFPALQIGGQTLEKCNSNQTIPEFFQSLSENSSLLMIGFRGR